jgi:hypothetical protein
MNLTNTREISHILVCIDKGLKPVAIEPRTEVGFSPITNYKTVVRPSISSLTS